MTDKKIIEETIKYFEKLLNEFKDLTK